MFTRDPYVEIYHVCDDQFMVRCMDCGWTEVSVDRNRLAVAATRHKNAHAVAITR